ncbi:MAG: V-type ATP synthase subunit E [Clostridiales bacterium]|nr:V-type ATP synthase subunit E [Clostridiales bacterium]
MNGIDKIAGKITEDVRAEIETVLAEAKSEAGAIAERYAALAKEESDKALAAGKVQAEEIRRRAASAAEQEAKQQLLATKQSLISRAFDAALHKLLALPEPEYTGLLAKLAAEASTTGSEELVFSPKDKNGCGQKVLDGANGLLAKAGKKGALTISAEAGSFEGGFLMKSGDVEVNCTLDTILRLSREDLTLDVAHALFG